MIASIASVAQQGTDTTLTQSGVAADAKVTGDEIRDLKSAVSNAISLGCDEIMSGTYSGTTMKEITVSIPAGNYKLKIGSVTSSDTDDVVSRIVFMNSSGSTTILSLYVNRNRPIEQNITLSSDVGKIGLYASKNYTLSSGDEFSFNSIVIESTYELKTKIDNIDKVVDLAVPIDLVTNHTNAKADGVSFVWDSKNKTCNVSGTPASGARYDLINTIANGFSDFLTPGNDYYIVFNTTTSNALRFSISYWLDGHSTASASDVFTRITENTKLSLPANTTALVAKIDFVRSEAINGVFEAKVYANGYPNGILSDSVRDMSEDFSNEIANINRKCADPDDLLPEVQGDTSSGITYNLVEKGHYVVNGTATANNTWFNLILSVESMPEGFKAGKTYYLRYFTDDPRLNVRGYSYDSSQASTTIISRKKHSCEFTIPADAVGLVIRVGNDYEGYTYDYIHFEIAVFEADNYRIDEIKKYQWAPRPMLTIIDDDGRVSYKTYLLPLVTSKHSILTSAVPALYPYWREITETYLDAKQKYQEEQISEEEFLTIKAEFDALRAKIGKSSAAEDAGLLYMSWDEIAECRENGADIVSHTYSHSLSLDKLPESNIQHEYQMAKYIMENHGIPCDVLVYAGDTGRSKKVRRACSKVFNFGIYCSGEVINYVGDDPHYIQRFGVGDETITWDLQTIQTQLYNLAMSRTGWMIWTIHTSNETWGADKAAIIGSTIDYAQSINLPIVSASCGANTYFGNVYKPFTSSDINGYG